MKSANPCPREASLRKSCQAFCSRIVGDKAADKPHDLLAIFTFAHPMSSLRGSLIIVLLWSLAACQPHRPRFTGLPTLDDLRRASPGLAAAFAPGPTSYQMFDCSRSELLSLHTSRASIARIGDGATPETQKPTNIPESEDGALLGRLLDYHSYADATVCDFDPALTITCQTSKGTYRFSVCFACSDILIRLPSGERRKVHMVPELRRAILRVARGIYPDDSVLKPLYRKYRV